MFVEAISGEKPVEKFCCKGIWFEVVSCPAVFWCGTLGYAQNCTDEPDIGGLLRKYQALCGVPKLDLAKPEWSCAISIDYWKNGESPRGMMFSQQVLTKELSSLHPFTMLITNITFSLLKEFFLFVKRLALRVLLFSAPTLHILQRSAPI